MIHGAHRTQTSQSPAATCENRAGARVPPVCRGDLAYVAMGGIAPWQLILCLLMTALIAFGAFIAVAALRAARKR
ncbi:hypothetical protein KRMM14A1259_42550 [Krasilnikovia sp. MM14-A1259]